MTTTETLAAIRIIGAVARADGKITDEERGAFAAAVTEFEPNLPDGTTVESLLTQESDLEADLAAVTTPMMRHAVFEAAYAMSTIDGAHEDENKLLVRIRAAFALERADSSFDKAIRSMRRGRLEPILDPTERNDKVGSIIGRRMLTAGVMGAIPFPFIGDVAVLLQVWGVVEDISLVWGHPMTRKEKWAHFSAVLSIALLQSAAHSLVKMIPGWGSIAGAVTGGISAYVVVGSVGQAVKYHFEKEGKTTPEELRQVFKDQKSVLTKSYADDKSKIDAIRDASKDEITALTTRLQKDEITLEEFETQVEAITRREKD